MRDARSNTGAEEEITNIDWAVGEDGTAGKCIKQGFFL